MKKVHITTLGCSKNLVDSEVLSGQLEAHEFEMVDEPADSDLIIVNTCGFIQSAKEESLQAIFEAIKLKEDDPAKKVFVTGCLSERYKPDIEKEIPEVDAIFGTEAYKDILSALGKKHAANDNLHRMRKVTTPRHFAYLKISEGCNHTCAFCAIPGIRGKLRSRSIESLVDEAAKLAANGAKELILISQDTSSYGKDIYNKQNIVDLLKALAQIDGIEWIRVLYWYPTNFPFEVIQLMKDNPKILPYIDMPIQHVSDHMLQLMRRGERKETIYKIFNRIRAEIPHITLRTTLIVGHPGETNDDFSELLAFINDFQFDRMGSFLYSDEENTAAYLLQNKVDVEVARQRQDELMSVQRDLSGKKNALLIGTVQRVLLDEYDINTSTYVGRTYRDAPEIDNEIIITVDKEYAFKPGDFADVEIIDSGEYELFGRFVG